VASIRQWIQLTLAHTSPAQVVEGVGVAWFIFVLVLLLLSRTDGAEPLHPKLQVHVSLDTAPPSLHLPHRPVLELPYAADDNPPSDSAEVSQVSKALDLRNGYLLALTRIAATDRRWVPYSFFVAECVGQPTSNSDGSSRQTVVVIVCLVAPLLARDTAVANECISWLFEMAALPASSLQRHDGIRTAADVTVTIAGIMVISSDV